MKTHEERDCWRRADGLAKTSAVLLFAATSLCDDGSEACGFLRAVETTGVRLIHFAQEDCCLYIAQRYRLEAQGQIHT